MTRRFWLWLCLGALTVGMMGVTSGCNTVEGAGRDIEAGGDAIADTARDVQD